MVLDPAQLMFWFVIGLLDLLPLISPCHPPPPPPSVASLNQACIASGFAALSAETRKHKANDPNAVSYAWWVCVPLAVETYGNWGKEARDTFSRLATWLAIGSPKSKSSCIYSRLNLTLTRSVVRAIMVRTLVS